MLRTLRTASALALLTGTSVAGILVGPAAHAAPSSSDTAGIVRVAPRPAGVPARFVLTPNGYFAPSCVHQVAGDQILVPDGAGTAIVTVAPTSSAHASMAKASGVSTAASPQNAGAKVGAADQLSTAQIKAAPHVARCAYDHYDMAGHAIAPDADRAGPAHSVSPPSISGWVENGSTHALGSMSYLHAQWNIPSAPSKKTGQVVYFFPGLEDIDNVVTIMQPVLGWNQNGSGWTAASWNCCHAGNTYHSAFIPVTGSTMSGDVSGNGCSTSTGVCSSWAITTYIWSSERSTTLNTSAFGQHMNWVFGGVLEVYTVTSCSQLPGGSVKNSAFYLEDVANVRKYPSWSKAVTSGLSPACGYGVTIGSDRSVTVKY